jgi:hypothetical protein
VVKIFAPASYFDAIICYSSVAMGVFFLFVYNVFVPLSYIMKRRNLLQFQAGCCGTKCLLNYIFIGLFGYKLLDIQL